MNGPWRRIEYAGRGGALYDFQYFPAPQTRNRQTAPSPSIHPAVGAAKCVPITNVSVPASAPNIRRRVAVDAASPA